MLMLNQGKWRTVTELVNLIMVLKRPSLDLSIGRIAKKHYLTGSNWRDDLKKQFVSGTRIFINENLTLKNKHLAFNCRQLKKGTIYSAHLRRNAIVYNKQNENSRPVVIQNMNALHDMFPNFYDLSKGGNENRDILGDQNVSVLSSC